MSFDVGSLTNFWGATFLEGLHPNKNSSDINAISFMISSFNFNQGLSWARFRKPGRQHFAPLRETFATGGSTLRLCAFARHPCHGRQHFAPLRLCVTPMPRAEALCAFT